jgi:hypothetical protein
VFGARAAQIESVERSLRETLGWTSFLATWEEAGLPRAALPRSVHGYIVLGDPPDSVIDELAVRPESVPLVSVGARPLPDATCWLPKMKSPRLLASLLEQLIEHPRSQAGKTEQAPLFQAYREAKDQFDAEYYSRLLRAAGGNIALAARLAKRTRAQVYDALRRLALDPSRFRGDERSGMGRNG